MDNSIIKPKISSIFKRLHEAEDLTDLSFIEVSEQEAIDSMNKEYFDAKDDHIRIYMVKRETLHDFFKRIYSRTCQKENPYKISQYLLMQILYRFEFIYYNIANHYNKDLMH